VSDGEMEDKSATTLEGSTIRSCWWLSVPNEPFLRFRSSRTNLNPANLGSRSRCVRHRQPGTSGEQLVSQIRPLRSKL
jgi:hypothetical protein